MRDNEIEKLREMLNLMIDSDDVSGDDILKVSRELDVLIVKYIEKNNEGRLNNKRENSYRETDRINSGYKT